MQAGISQAGPPLELYDRPSDLFTAGFIGSLAMNFIDAVRAEGGVLAADGTVLPLAPGQEAPAGQLVAGLRPEHLTIYPGPGDAVFHGTVYGIENLGGEVEIYVEALGTKLCIRAFDRNIPAPGELIGIGYPPAKLHVFDKATGKRADLIARKASSDHDRADQLSSLIPPGR